MDRLQCAIEANSLFRREKKTRVAVVNDPRRDLSMRNRRAGLQHDGASSSRVMSDTSEDRSGIIGITAAIP